MATGDLYGAQLCNLPWIPHLLNTALISKCIFKCVEFIFAVCVCVRLQEKESLAKCIQDLKSLAAQQEAVPAWCHYLLTATEQSTWSNDKQHS